MHPWYGSSHRAWPCHAVTTEKARIRCTCIVTVLHSYNMQVEL